ncbi:hypothetical protein ONZ51_g2201 [Trametes cubensis]|uniref:DUF6697 domain-containing protein n=1 Tax=Trametes cubensis TaxID=1111947 RepID=A0AAD7XGX0_9APHY|nr:hypothetical protein ONZ51_g2201 [Trametes cubensis]
MEPDFIRQQVHNVWRVLSANAKLVQDRRLTIEGAFVDTEFVVDQAVLLYEAVVDSVSIYMGNIRGQNRDLPFLIMRPEFLSQQAEMLKAVIDDSVRLQDMSKTSFSDLTSLGDTFVLNMVNNIRDVVTDVASAAGPSTVPVAKLSIARPLYVQKLALSFQCVMNAYLLQRRGVVILHEKRVAAEHAEAELKAQKEALATENAAALSKISELEATVATLRQECEQRETSAQQAAEAAQGRISKLEQELAILSEEHLRCPSPADTQESELDALREDYKALIQTQEAHCEAVAQSAQELETVKNEKLQLQQECDKTVAELSKVRKAHEEFTLTRAQEYERMNAEILRLDDALREKTITANALSDEKTRLKASLDGANDELKQVQTQLAATVIQCDTWKAAMDDMVTRQMDVIEEARQQAAAQEREIVDKLLNNATKKIEDLEAQLKEKDSEIDSLRDASSRQTSGTAVASAMRLPASPPPSSRKRAFTEDKLSKASASTSKGSAYTLDLTSHGSPLPPDRLKELASFPEIAVDFGPGQTTPAIFTRQSLSNILGGSIQGLIVRCTKSATTLACENGIQDYLCPNMDHNAWSPPGPGKHGYIQVGLGRDRKLFNTGVHRHVFVGAGKHFVYCGWYLVLRVEPLTKDEWSTLPPKVRNYMCSSTLVRVPVSASTSTSDANASPSPSTQVQGTYSETTVNKEHSNELRSAEQVLGMYNAGTLRAPCVRLQCVGFDTEFYRKLVRANDLFFENKPRPPPPPPSAGAAGPSFKRRRTTNTVAEDKAEDSEEEVSLAAAAVAAKTKASTSSPGIPANEQPQGSTSTGTTSENAPPVGSSSNTSVPPANAGGAPATQPVPSTMRQTRLAARTQSGSLTLRIPGRTLKDHSWGADDVLELTSESDDDDLYADF